MWIGKTKKVFPVLIVLMGVGIGVYMSLSRNNWEHADTIRVAFPNKQLLNRANLLDPKNLEITQEYYLLENLSSTLIRDSLSATTRHEGVMAKSWELKEKTITFLLKPNLKWSDGSPLTCPEIKNHFLRLVTENSRHLQYLKSVESVSCDEKLNSISFTFKEKVSAAALNEFGLADSSIVKTESNGQPRWDITSGQYFLKNSDKEKLLIVLNKNEHYSEFPSKSPKIVILKDISGKKDLSILFTEQASWDDGIDFFAPQGWNFFPETVKLLNSDAKKLSGQPSIIHFVYFLKGSEKIRARTRTILKSSPTINQEPPPYLAPFDQMIPPGYKGHLNELANLQDELAENHKIKMLLVARPPYKALSSYLERLRREFNEKNIELTISFEQPDANKDHSVYDAVIGLSLFKGNMTDPLGSWSFLADKEHGSLKAFSDKIEPIFKKIILSESETEKSELLNHLHIMTLKEKMLIPLWIEPMYFIYSSRVTPARSNPFDLRIRFFELDMNETK